MTAVKYHLGKFPPPTLEWERLLPLVGPANAAVARYDGVLTAIPNASVLLSPLTTQEAVLSSKIEGTQATMGEVLEFEAEGGRKKVPDEKREDINEVLNYRKATRHAEQLMKELPLCQRVLKAVHQVLLDGVRGHGKDPGEYRRKANSILELYNRMKLKMVEISHSQFSIHALDWIFAQPIFSSTDFTQSSGIPKPTAARILRVLKEENILQVWSEGRGNKPAVYGYADLLNTAEGYKVF